MKIENFKAVELDPEEIFYEYKIEYNTQIIYCVIPINDVLSHKSYKEADLFVYNRPSSNVTIDNEQDSIVHLPINVLKKLYELCLNF